ncbi:WXG100-like domain-containing protein [Streptomyces gibsoniae]|uniref:PE-PGRS family protein n=1 Tax=Streptomyces gibsoniae TaxID=3075529 RepID=A0ABU2U5R9_9ACTN|nr:PE-PGRS family protein [Streptomyces sp. DSM 41699]MDT0468577.1 PE-PGRS family protein [Streptomyces sp. DSM 41699]
MSLTLPSELVWVLDLLGYSWPEVDEEALHEVAETWRNFGAELEGIQAQGERFAGTVIASNMGSAVDGFSKAWGAYTGANGEDRYIPDAQTACEVIALAFDAAAVAVLTAKLAVIAQLVTLAVEIIAAQAAAPFTFGLSEIGGLGATQAARVVVRELLEQLKKEVMETITKAMEHASMDALKKIAKEQLEKVTKEKVKQYAKDQIKEQAKQFVQEKVVDTAKDKAKEAAIGMAQNIGQQSIETYFDARSGIDLGETAGVAKTAAGEYVDDLKNEATGGEGSTFADYTDVSGHVDNAVDSATEKVTGTIGDRAQRGVDALTGHGAHSTEGADDAADTDSGTGSGSSRAAQASTRVPVTASAAGTTGTTGGARDWARSEFG